MNVYFRLLNSGRLFTNVKRRISICSVNMKSWNPVLEARYYELGRGMLELAAIEVMVKDFPSIPAHQVNEIAIGLTKSSLLNMSELPIEKDVENEEALSIMLGTMQLKNEDDKVKSLLEAVKKNIHSTISSPQSFRSLIISQHPKALLEKFSAESEHTVSLKSYMMSNGDYEAKVYLDDEKMFMAQNFDQDEAERIVCLELLYHLYADKLKSTDVENFDFPLEVEVALGLLTPNKRIIEMKKSPDEPFGLTIRGGEPKVLRSKEYIQFHTITPIFISAIAKDSPAEKCGLQAGHIILAVNDHFLKNCTHKEAVSSLKKFTSAEEVSFTVIFNKNELLKYEAEKDLLERQNKKIKEEISHEHFKKWHHAKAKMNPQQYLVGKIENKKRDFVPKNSRKAIRLWDYRDFKK